jgi:hypothetical protein
MIEIETTATSFQGAVLLAPILASRPFRTGDSGRPFRTNNSDVCFFPAIGVVDCLGFQGHPALWESPRKSVEEGYDRDTVLQKAQRKRNKWLRVPGRAVLCREALTYDGWWDARNAPSTDPTLRLESTEAESFRDSSRRGRFSDDLAFDRRPSVRKGCAMEGATDGGLEGQFEVQDLPVTEGLEVDENVIAAQRAAQEQAIKDSADAVAKLRVGYEPFLQDELLRLKTEYRLTNVHSCAHVRKKRWKKGKLVEIRRNRQRYLIGMLPHASKEEINAGDEILAPHGLGIGEIVRDLVIRQGEYKGGFNCLAFSIFTESTGESERFTPDTLPPYQERERLRLVRKYHPLIRGLGVTQATDVLITHPDWENDVRRNQIVETMHKYVDVVPEGVSYQKFMDGVRRDSKMHRETEMPEVDRALSRMPEKDKIYWECGWFAVVTLNDRREAKYLGPLVAGERFKMGDLIPDRIHEALVASFEKTEKQAAAHARRTKSGVRTARARVSQAYENATVYRNCNCAQERQKA